MKPPGVSMGFGPNGLRLSVIRSNRATDAVWEAVQEAVIDGMSFQEFVSEAKEAWKHELNESIKDIDRHRT